MPARQREPACIARWSGGPLLGRRPLAHCLLVSNVNHARAAEDDESKNSRGHPHAVKRGLKHVVGVVVAVACASEVRMRWSERRKLQEWGGGGNDGECKTAENQKAPGTLSSVGAAKRTSTTHAPDRDDRCQRCAQSGCARSSPPGGLQRKGKHFPERGSAKCGHLI